MQTVQNTVTLGIIIPCYNESQVIIHTHTRLHTILQKIVNENMAKPDSFITYVNDGSTDDTQSCLLQIKNSYSNVKIITLSRNFGHQNALFAGLECCMPYADVLISMDADLQDDPEAMIEMLKHYYQGIDIVYGVRRSRDKDTFFKKSTAHMYYKFIRFMGVTIVHDHSDYRLISARALQALMKHPEINLFLRGLVASIGFKTSIVYYHRHERAAGVTKYSIPKMLSFAIEGITSFSVQPLRLVFVAGVLVSLFSFAMTLFAIISLMFFDVVHGWFSTVLPIYFLGGIQLLSIGILGEYIGKIYKEVKGRPRYIIQEIID
ncbi:MAG: glycosyltransferase family 2 protein [Cytophagales bacterium]|nr:glycosyltransferase family 2 protein [Cytophagales bacterium]